MTGFTNTQEGYVHNATGVRLVVHGRVGRWGAYRFQKEHLVWIVKPRFKTAEALIRRLRERGLV